MTKSKGNLVLENTNFKKSIKIIVKFVNMNLMANSKSKVSTNFYFLSHSVPKLEAGPSSKFKKGGNIEKIRDICYSKQ